METNIRDYPLYYWIIALAFDVVLNVAPVLVSFYSFYNERDKFFKDANFRNEAFERYEKEKLKNKIKEEEKNKLSRRENLPQIDQNKPTISENINKNVNNNDNKVNDNALSVGKPEISFDQNKSPEEKKYSYQNYLKKSTANLNQINQGTEQTVQNYNVHIDSKNQLNTNPTYTNVKFYSESNLMDNKSNKINFDNLNKDFAEDLKHIDMIENDLLRKYRREIRCGFIITIGVLIIDTYSNIDTFINLKPRFLDTQFILYNNSYLINEKNLIYNKNVVYEKYLKLAYDENANEEKKSTKANRNLKNKVIESNKNNNNDSNKNLKFMRLQNSNYLYQNSSKETDINLKENFDIILRSLNQEELNKNEALEQDKFIYSNLQEYMNITLKREFNISNCKYYSKSDLKKIDYIYQYSAVRYSLLIINTILDLFIMMLTTIGFLYKVEINKLYQSKFIVVLLFLLNKCWSMCAVAHSYFNLTTNECLNAIDYFSEFFYAYLSYVFLFFSLIFIIIIYSLFCRQLLYYILMILVSGLTLFIPALFCLEKQQRCMKKIYEKQELHLKDDLEDIRNFRFRRKKQNFQLLMAYLVFVFIVLNGLSALVNFGILKYIWIMNSWRTLAPAVGSITTFVVTFFQRCYN